MNQPLTNLGGQKFGKLVYIDCERSLKELGENSVFQKEKLGLTRKLVIQNFPFFRTLLTQKTDFLFFYVEKEGPRNDV